MKEFTAACVQIAITPNDTRANIIKSIQWLKKAVAEYQAELVVFPETVTTGFDTALSAEDLWDLVDEAPGSLTEEIQAAAKDLRVHVVWPTYRRGEERGKVFNSSILIGPGGEIIGIYDKTHPFPGERRDSGGWTEVGTQANVYETDLGNIGMLVCYDAIFPEISRMLAVRGAEIICCIFNRAKRKPEDMLPHMSFARAYENRVFFVSATGWERSRCSTWAEV